MPSEVRRETELPAEPDEVWRAMTETGDPDGWLGKIERIELEPGGALEITTGNGERRSGWVEEVDEGSRLTFWWDAAEQEASRVELELERLEPGTRIAVTESRPLQAPETQLLPEVPRGRSGNGPLALAH